MLGCEPINEHRSSVLKFTPSPRIISKLPGRFSHCLSELSSRFIQTLRPLPLESIWHLIPGMCNHHTHTTGHVRFPILTIAGSTMSLITDDMLLVLWEDAQRNPTNEWRAVAVWTPAMDQAYFLGEGLGGHVRVSSGRQRSSTGRCHDQVSGRNPIELRFSPSTRQRRGMQHLRMLKRLSGPKRAVR